MCGIAGYLEWNTSDSAASDIAQELLNSLSHRGPDENILTDIGSGVIGMRRLSINGLSEGLYPVASTSGRYVAVFNGEIYNFKLLRQELATHGRWVDGRSDGQVLAEGYDLWGDNLFRRLRGMWAVALWDFQEKALLLARDPIGIKPLYFFSQPNGFAFSSELQAIRHSHFLRKTSGRLFNSLTPQMLSRLLVWMYAPVQRESPFDGILQVLPGEVLRVQQNHYATSTRISIWDGIDSQEPISSAEELESILAESVKSHMVSDVPVALCLSGGLDSALLAALVKRTLNMDVKSFTAGFVDDPRSESIQASHTAASLGVNHYSIPLDARQIAQSFSTYTKLFGDLSTLDGGVITTYLLAQEMRRHGIKVALFGEGADEVFGGYTWFGLGSGIYSFFPKPLIVRLYSYANTRDFRSGLFEEQLDSLSRSRMSNYEYVQHNELSCQLPSHLLAKVDRGTMAASVEGRVPYLDIDLIRRVLATPIARRRAHLRYGLIPEATTTKPLLRSVAPSVVGPSLANQPKKGFMLPLDSIVTHQLPSIIDLLNSRNSITPAPLKRRLLKTARRGVNAPLRVSEVWALWRCMVVESVMSDRA